MTSLARWLFLKALSSVSTEPKLKQILRRLLPLNKTIARGILVHGPLLGWAKMLGDNFFMYVQDSEAIAFAECPRLAVLDFEKHQRTAL